MLKRRGARTDPCGTPFLRVRSLLHMLLPVMRVKLRLTTISMIMRTMCLSDRNWSSLKVRPRCHRVVGCCDIDKHSSGLLLSRKSNACVQSVLKAQIKRIKSHYAPSASLFLLFMLLYALRVSSRERIHFLEGGHSYIVDALVL